VTQLAEKDDKLIFDALRRAAAEQAGLPLVQSRNQPGLFPATATGKAAAEGACNTGWLIQTGQDDEWTITEAGMARLMELSNPRQVLEDCARAIEARQSQLEKIRTAVTRTHASLDGLRVFVERALRPDATDLNQTIIQILAPWDRDCPLPDLYRSVQEAAASATVGEFHDALRQLRKQEQIALHPWTGPLHAMPEPDLALLCGHEIAYYAAVRKDAGRANRLGWDKGSTNEVIASRVASLAERMPTQDRR
jgi:hypothetical protein